jgi:hypothetical protein
MNKFKKTIATALAMLMTISVLPMQAGAAIADDAAAEEDVEPIMEYAPDGADVDVSSNGSGVDTCEPIMDPQFTYADADQSATDALLHESEISPLDIWEDEPTDLTLKLGGISDAAAKAEGDSGNFPGKWPPVILSVWCRVVRLKLMRTMSLEVSLVNIVIRICRVVALTASICFT